MRVRLYLHLTALCACLPARASVTLQFSQTSVARATGFADHLGTPTNGMTWGILVDGAGNGFQGGAYDVFSISSGTFLEVGGTPTDDFFVPASVQTLTLGPTGGDPGGVGGITAIGPIFTSYPSGIGVGDAFRIMWFESTPAPGTYYGLFSDASFILPTDGFTVSYATVFAGGSPDPAKPASFQFALVPEPSLSVLSMLGSAALLFRRRRARRIP